MLHCSRSQNEKRNLAHAIVLISSMFYLALSAATVGGLVVVGCSGVSTEVAAPYRALAEAECVKRVTGSVAFGKYATELSVDPTELAKALCATPGVTATNVTELVPR